ncbi:hypothetical protein BLNAU_1941 [Blattamonas nauphoetae]|uniref:Right handed beta helix domain-containing protein n=1 Tax=Blattamonas nauphoetae TaxID=2049346 RepID=A0ABQ9YGR7_9EUKA|nr:hypothetical protein BLNAU_1941 [Blattamonas nauphoetae]
MLCVSVVVFADKHDEHSPSFDLPSFVFVCDAAADWGVSVGIDESSLRDKRDAVGLVRIVSAVELRITEPTPEQGQTIDEFTSGTTRIHKSQAQTNTTVSNPVWFYSCQFADLNAPGSGDGAAIFLNQYRADVVIKACSFTRCHTSYSHAHGGAVFLSHFSTSTAANVYSATVFNCQFTNNTAGFGGHLSIQHFNPVTVAQCTFTESQNRTGSATQKWSSVRVSIKGDCRFDNCTLSRNTGSTVGGIEFLQDLPTGKMILTDVLFFDNKCSDVADTWPISDFCFYFDTDMSYRR